MGQGLKKPITEEVRYDQLTIRKALTAALALTLAATLTSATSFAKDGDNDRKSGKGQIKTGSFQFVAPKADRGGDAGKATAKFLPPKSGRDNGGNAPPRCSG